MPFKKVGSDDYVSPSGRHWTAAQVRLYYATKGFKKKPKKKQRRTREFNPCHAPDSGRFCSTGGKRTAADIAADLARAAPERNRAMDTRQAKAAPERHRAMDTWQATGPVEREQLRRLRGPTWPNIDPRSGTVTAGGRKKRRRYPKIDRRGRLTFEAVRPEEILAEERARVLEAWTDAARQASAATRRGRAKPKSKSVPRGTGEGQLSSAYVAAQSRQQREELAARAAAKRRGVPYTPPEVQADTGATARIRGHVDRAEAARRAGAAGQRADLAKAAAERAAKNQRLVAYAKRDAAEAKKKGGAPKDPVAEQRKALAAEHDAKLKPLARELMALSAAGKRATPEYKAKYAAYQKVQAAKKAALATTTVQAPEGEARGQTSKAKSRAPTARTVRVRVGQARYRKGNAFAKGRTVVRINR